MQKEFLFPPEELSPIAKRFAKYHAENPHIYEGLVALAKQFRRKNPNRKMAIAMLYEVMRWNYYVSVETDEEYKLSNDFRAPYARLIMKQEPDMKDAFNLRNSEVDL